MIMMSMLYVAFWSNSGCVGICAMFPHPSEPVGGGGCGGVVTPPQARGFEMHTTKENIKRFFDPNQYRKENQPMDNPAHSQKRPASSCGGSSSAPPSTRPKTMSKDELLDKFKLAAELNGLSWCDLVVP